MQDPDEAIQRIDDWAAGFARKAERYEAARQRTEQLSFTASSKDGTVKVTVGADGVVSGLEFGQKTRTIPPEELSRMVLSTMREAQARITSQVAEVMQDELGDEDQQTRSAMLDSLRSRFPDPEDPQDGPPAPPTPPTPPTPTPPAPPQPPSGGGAATPPQAPDTPPATGENPATRSGGKDPEEEDNTPW